MANFRLYGANPSELSAQQQNYDRYFLGADQANRAAAMEATRASIENAARIRAEDEAAAQRDWQRQQHSVALALAENQRQQENALRERALGIDMTRYADSRATEADRFNKEFGLKTGELAVRDRKVRLDEDFARSQAELQKTQEIPLAIEALNADAAKLIAQKVGHISAAAAKAGRQATDADFASAAQLNEYELNALKTRAGAVGDLLRWDPVVSKFIVASTPQPFQPVMGKVPRDLTPYQSAIQPPAPRVDFPMTSNQGGGYVPVARPPTSIQSYVTPTATGTNAAPKRRLVYNPATGNLE